MNTRPEMCEALEWADSPATARRLQTLRHSIMCGWHSDDRVGRATRPETADEPWRRIAATLLGQR